MTDGWHATHKSFAHAGSRIVHILLADHHTLVLHQKNLHYQIHQHRHMLVRHQSLGLQPQVEQGEQGASSSGMHCFAPAAPSVDFLIPTQPKLYLSLGDSWIVQNQIGILMTPQSYKAWVGKRHLGLAGQLVSVAAARLLAMPIALRINLQHSPCVPPCCPCGQP